MQIKTTKLQELLSKATKGVGNNKLIPLTSLMALEVKDGELTVTTTDATNYFYVKEKVDGDDFYVCIQADQFSKLVSKITTESITLTVKDNALEVRGNGTYSIPLPIDVDGSIVKYPNPLDDVTLDNKIGEFSVATIKDVLSTIKPGLAVKMDFPQYTNYYMGDCVIATDTFKVNHMDEQVFDTPKLVSGDTMNLLDVVTDDTIEVYENNGKLIFSTPSCIVYGVAMNGIEDFPVDVINGYVSQKFPSMCKLPKANILQLLDRIALFVSDFDDGAIELTFTREGLLVSNRQSSGTELIPYIEIEDFADLVGSVDILMLQTQIKAQRGDVIELWFGEPNAIKLVDDNITSVVALLE